MSSTGTHSFHFAGLDWEVSYTFTPGCPEAPPSYAHGGLPADPDEVELFGFVILTTGEPLDADTLFDSIDERTADKLCQRIIDDICERENDR